MAETVKKRDLGEVVEKIKPLAPKSIHGDLDRVVKDSKTTAPELMYLRWQAVHEILISSVANLHSPTKEEMEMFKIFSGTN